MSQPKMSPEVFAAECDAVIDQAMAQIHPMLGVAPRDQVLALIATDLYERYEFGQVAPIAATALVRLADEQALQAKTESNFEEWVEAHKRDEEAADNAFRVDQEALEGLEKLNDELQDRIGNLATDLLETRAQLAEVRDERDSLLNEMERLRADRRWEANRANEAARLSANARDDADAHLKTIADLQEQVGIVESDRLAIYAWAINVLAEHDIECEAGHEYDSIAAFIRAVRKDNATLAEFGDRAVESREWAFDQLRQVTAERDEVNAEVSRLRVELEATQDDRDEALHGVRHWQTVADEMESDIQRYRQAWLSARQRASNHLAALVDADEERDALRAELREREP